MSTPPDVATTQPTKVRALIIAAMESELAPYLAAAVTITEPEQWGEATVRLARLAEHLVVLVTSGIGLVNGASAAVSALQHFDPELVISTGSAGGFAGAIEVGQVAVGSQHSYHQADARAFGYALGQVPGMPVSYPADPAALAVAAQLPQVVVGLHLSADVFVAGELIERVQAAFPEAVAVEMEATAIAQVCHSHRVGFLSVRGISDLCGADAAADHAETVEAVSAAAFGVVVRVLAGEGEGEGSG